MLLGLAATAHGSVLRALSVQQLRDRAEAIVSGKVVGVRSVRAGGSVETIVRVRVEHAWRGTDSRTLELRTPGGIAAGRRLSVPGAPAFERGQRVLLFLERDADAWRPVGMFQGVWRLDREHPGIALASPSGGAAVMRQEAGVEAAVDRGQRTLHELIGRPGGGR